MRIGNQALVTVSGLFTAIVAFWPRKSQVRSLNLRDAATKGSPAEEVQLVSPSLRLDFPDYKCDPRPARAIMRDIAAARKARAEVGEKLKKMDQEVQRYKAELDKAIDDGVFLRTYEVIESHLKQARADREHFRSDPEKFAVADAKVQLLKMELGYSQKAAAQTN
ncbi:MAG TPA: hypothetical protein VE973_01575 [Candidatus Limnocylindria bacterium]|nr:hypothetical protein [Candidatus Limnocylindria bacterium]